MNKNLKKGAGSGEFTKDEENFMKDLGECQALLRSAFDCDTIDSSIVFAAFDAVGAPDDLAPSEREQLVDELRKAASLAREVIGASADAETFFKVFYIFTATLDDDDLEPEEAFLRATTIAKRVFGENAGVNEILEVFERFYVAEAEDDDEDDDEENEDDE